VTRLGEASSLARSVLQSLDKRQPLSTALRQCERLADLVGDEFMRSYASRALSPGMMDTEIREALEYVRANQGSNTASGVFRSLQDFQISGTRSLEAS